jgi:flagellar hook-associated protein FlgK
MDLRAAQHAALTGLTVAEAQSAVASSNIANAPGHRLYRQDTV